MRPDIRRLLQASARTDRTSCRKTKRATRPEAGPAGEALAGQLTFSFIAPPKGALGGDQVEASDDGWLPGDLSEGDEGAALLDGGE